MTIFPFDTIPRVFCPSCMDYKEAKRWTIGDSTSFNYECNKCHREFRLIDIVIALNKVERPENDGFVISKLGENY